jgi:tripartite-type tricarboxylate transporter receptor subunit TctC
MMINFTSSSLPLVRQGQLRALAVTTHERLPVAPDLPTMAEAGVAGVEVSSWSGFLVPAKTPDDIIETIQAGTAKVLAQPSVRDKLENSGAVIVGSTPAELASFLRHEMEKWAPVIKAAKISVQ